MGYSVENIGIEDTAKLLIDKLGKTSTYSKLGKPIHNMLRTMPDMLISRQKIDSKGVELFLVESKFRKNIDSLEECEAKLMWQYRKIIWKDTYSTYLIKKYTEFTHEIWLEEDADIRFKKTAVAVFRNFSNKEKEKYHKIGIIFYLLVPKNGIKIEVWKNYLSHLNSVNSFINENFMISYNEIVQGNENIYVHCNYSLYPLWWAAGDGGYDKYSYYQSSKYYSGFNEVYTESIVPALKKINFSF